MKSALCLLLLSFSLQRIKCQSMESIESTLVKKPGETLTLSCRGSGFSFGCCSMHWIRQHAGKPLVWMGRVYSHGNSHDFSDSFSRRIEITRHNSKSMVYLKLSGLTGEDSAIYYCARDYAGGWVAGVWVAWDFDYWGKGTKVTVSSAEQSAPKSNLAMSQCTSDPDGFLTIGCMARGFAPADSLTFTWTDSSTKVLSDVVQYPAFGRNGEYTKISHLRVRKSDWDPKKPYQCEASNSKGTIKSLVAPRSPRNPTLSLVPVTTLKSKSVMCIIEDFYPKNNLSVQWKINDTNSMSQLKLESKLNNQGYFKGYSLYEVSSENWDVNTQYTCEVTHQGGQFHTKANFKTKLSLTLKPPIQKELFVNAKIVLQAVVSGDVNNAGQETSVSCKVKDERVPNKNITTGNVEFLTDTSQFIRIHNVIIDTNKWFDGEMVTCTIRDTNNDRDIKQEIHFDKGDESKPSVTIYKPDSNVSDTDRVSHVCKVTSPKLGNVYIMWKVGGKPYIEGTTSAPIHQKESTSVLSILTMTKEEYKNPSNTITCAVIHANMNNRRSPLQVSTSQSKQTELSCD